jgi:hypothetical protein
MAIRELLWRNRMLSLPNQHPSTNRHPSTRRLIHAETTHSYSCALYINQQMLAVLWLNSQLQRCLYKRSLRFHQSDNKQLPM